VGTVIEPNLAWCMVWNAVVKGKETHTSTCSQSLSRPYYSSRCCCVITTNVYYWPWVESQRRSLFERQSYDLRVTFVTINHGQLSFYKLVQLFQLYCREVVPLGSQNATASWSPERGVHVFEVGQYPHQVHLQLLVWSIQGDRFIIKN
jgi:hypothetical protein